jgi:hypothetical protein
MFIYLFTLLKLLMYFRDSAMTIAALMINAMNLRARAVLDPLPKVVSGRVGSISPWRRASRAAGLAESHP